MTADRPSGWNRSADLRAVEAAYAEYAATRRSRMWDERNPGYARLVGELRAALLELLRSSLRTGTTRICDLGCGTGDLATVRDALEAPTEWVGVDLRADAVRTARASLPDARFHVASADRVPEPSASFDVIVVQLLFSSLPSRDLERAVAREIGRLLAPGGSLLWVDLRYSNPANPNVHGLDRDRIRSLFPGWEMTMRSIGLLPPVARRLGWTTSVMYPVLSVLSALRSHQVGKLRQPGASG